MRLLLDTQVLIWSVVSPERLRAERLAVIRDRRHEVMFSVASIWEVAIKFGLRRPDFMVEPLALTAAARLDFLELPVTSSAVVRVADLPMHHRDPFDRLLVAQAIESDAVLWSADAALAAYSPHVEIMAPARA